ncbi:SGNH/GDSL hydrolase family protein [Xylanimonas oleitrophica]|uniref:SGNH/GDSL hydrolase family protein n=1 Tax=Xylanimonas oleitrophica TaxID=2607479 RepID=UPI0015CF8BA2|nr:SGNH/GDSL hydrolase family protein [Xylanimonas oleitrophica]
MSALEPVLPTPAGTPFRAVDPRGPRFVALGDSISAGVGDACGPDSPHGPGWAAHLATLAGASSFTNLARNGARARHVVDEQLPHALALLPDVATLVVGGNDVLRSDFSAYDVARDLSTAVTALRDCGCSVVLARLPAIGLFELMPTSVRRVMRARVTAVNEAVDAVALAARPRTLDQVTAARSGENGRPRQGTVTVVDIAAATRGPGPTPWHSDRVHPSAHGHRSLAVQAAVTLGRAGVIDVPGVPAARPTPPGTPQAPPPGPDTFRALAALLPASPPPPAMRQRAAWLVVAGVPWCLRRGRDFVPGLLRAVVDDLRGRAEAHPLPVHLSPVDAVGAEAAPATRVA